jgi:hypothetical protein
VCVADGHTRPSEAGEGGLEALAARYAGAEEWYTVVGSPVVAAGGEDHRALHEAALVRLRTPGLMEGGNELPVELRGP